MGIINIISDRKNITLNSDVILYIIMNGKLRRFMLSEEKYTRRVLL